MYNIRFALQSCFAKVDALQLQLLRDWTFLQHQHLYQALHGNDIELPRHFGGNFYWVSPCHNMEKCAAPQPVSRTISSFFFLSFPCFFFSLFRPFHRRFASGSHDAPRAGPEERL
jgi:hypothetical protein